VAGGLSLGDISIQFVRGHYQKVSTAQANVQANVDQANVDGLLGNFVKAAISRDQFLAAILDRHRLVCGNPSSGPIFANGKGKPANLNNTLNREILRAHWIAALDAGREGQTTLRLLSRTISGGMITYLCGMVGTHSGAGWRQRCTAWELMTRWFSRYSDTKTCR
jgi:hypothetical protein